MVTVVILGLLVLMLPMAFVDLIRTNIDPKDLHKMGIRNS